MSLTSFVSVRTEPGDTVTSELRSVPSRSHATRWMAGREGTAEETGEGADDERDGVEEQTGRRRGERDGEFREESRGRGERTQRRKSGGERKDVMIGKEDGGTEERDEV